ncbi:2-oxoacid:acceptor oxidoreductase subunit alpha [candidate division KSB1 bacterium]|nr:2-oxoacid:acceptor oxidoreductase subunit alpha [candidate division KSB1 bacterium]
MKVAELTIRFCGIAGDGVVTSGRILANVCSDFGLNAMVNDIYSAEIRGLGKSTTSVRFSTRKVLSMGDGIDMLVGMADRESISELNDVKPECCVIYDNSTPGDIKTEDSLAAHIPPELHGYGVPLKWLANQASGSNTGRNLVAMGALCYLYSLPETYFINHIKKLFGRKGERIVEVNVKAFQLGFVYCEENYPLRHEFEAPPKPVKQNLIGGNEAVCKGAIDWGLKFFAGYPITPATKIMEIAAKELPKRNGWTIQVEDEIAAISAVVGAGFAGKRAMTATAGPGLSLMSEMINLAVMAEIPAVIVNVQRGGPSTGLPTKVEQSDLNIALYGGAGDSPRVVIAPSDSEECYRSIQLALDLAEKYQTPVILLSDLFLGQRIETVALEENIDTERCTRKKPFADHLKDYVRYQLTDDGISPLIVPGEPGAFYTVTGLEHTTKGTPNYESEVHQRMTEKRFRKFEAMQKELPPAEVLGDAEAKIGLVSWGSTVGAILEGMEIARKQGVKSRLIKSMMINPQHEASFREFFNTCEAIIVPEMNFQGQYAALLKSRYGIQPIEMQVPAVNPVSPGKIANKIAEVAHAKRL